MERRRAAVAAVAGLMLAGGISAVSMSQPAPGGDAAAFEALYAARCKSCHEPPVPRAPGREQLRDMTNPHIVEALTSGTMKPMAEGLSPTQIAGLAAFLTGRSAPPRRRGKAASSPRPRPPRRRMLRPTRPPSPSLPRRAPSRPRC